MRQLQYQYRSAQPPVVPHPSDVGGLVARKVGELAVARGAMDPRRRSRAAGRGRAGVRPRGPAADWREPVRPPMRVRLPGLHARAVRCGDPTGRLREGGAQALRAGRVLVGAADSVGPASRQASTSCPTSRATTSPTSRASPAGPSSSSRPASGRSRLPTSPATSSSDTRPGGSSTSCPIPTGSVGFSSRTISLCSTTTTSSRRTAWLPFPFRADGRTRAACSTGSS